MLDGFKGDKKLKRAAFLHKKKLGRVLELWTDASGMQFYSGNNLKGVKGKGGSVSNRHTGLGLETRGFPDAVNHRNFA